MTRNRGPFHNVGRELARANPAPQPLPATVTVVAAFLLTALTLAAAPEPSARPRAQIYADLLDRHAAAAEALTSVQAGVTRVEALLERYDLSDENLAALISQLTTQRDALHLSITELEALVARLQELLTLDLNSVEAALAQRDQLLTKIEELEAAPPPEEEEPPLESAVSLEGLTPRPFLLTGDNLAPFSEPYFQTEYIKVRLPDRRVVERPRYTRVSDAGTITAAVQPGGVLHALVTAPDFDRDTTYIALWVCADAIEGYQQVVDFLQAHRVRYTWLPDVDQPWTALESDAPLGTWGYGG
ncbi:hypothetical protein [Actomonas aquatica]|uniref:Rhodanese domain-containing protein n=1 Tax=Actomonas aquatica TaxID=2866162 RepID=A0ABZ1C989_9BACT|nr:hypothetical protein [Opitutus sp. WL0086]WRQ87144.1 hypothetical protein K1X11_020215 [Opitutus sp. WL0086]